MSAKPRWVLTGASGWFGRSALWEYEQLYGPNALRSDVIACASEFRSIDFGSPHGPISAIPLEQLDLIDHADGLIHLAFLTRDRISVIGFEDYLASNRKITACIESFVARHSGMPIITTSSGAAAVFDVAPTDHRSDPYAALKQDEEALWIRKGSEHMAMVFRVFAASGRFIKGPEIFALSDFLCHALAGERIRIRCARQVLRSYVHVGTMTRLFWKMLSSPLPFGFQRIDAVMDTLSLIDLAKLISQVWNLPDPVYNIDKAFPTHYYCSDSADFLRLLEKYNITPPSLVNQLKETAIYLSSTK